MTHSLRSFFWCLAGLWMVMVIAGLTYAQQQHIPSALATAILPALLLEAALYVAPGFASVRERLLTLPKPQLALALTVSAVLPWLIYTLVSGKFAGDKFAYLLLLVAPVAFWYVVFPPSRLADFSLLVWLAVPFLTKLFLAIYPTADPKPRMDFLGKWMWIRLGFAVFLLVRQVEGIHFGFVPSRAEWRTGLKYYFRFLPFGVALGYLLGIVQVGFPAGPWHPALLALGTFLGLFWTVSLGEEFFFRGLIQQWLEQSLASPRAALLTTALLYGLVHLPFRSPFNWRYALLVGLLGIFCGQAYQEARGIRAPMVTHALAATTWVVIFQKGA
ncbi:MAG: CPBP family intramembrane metalloprotease [Bryobacteraceae bacterium]|nr:CPBP family intramembrane metalloprotease [Bryobacteraceae bacterium]